MVKKPTQRMLPEFTETHTKVNSEDTFYNNNKKQADKKISRNFNNLPLSAYNCKSWLQLISDTYLKVYGAKYPYYPINIVAESSILLNSVYPKVFIDNPYSAKDFKEFVEKDIKVSFNKNLKYSAALLKSDTSKRKFVSYSKVFKRRRRNSQYEDIIYIPHIPFTEEKHNLEVVLRDGNYSNIGVLCNFGVTIFHKYYQKMNLCSFAEAASNTKRIIVEELLEKYKNDMELLKSLVEIIFKNSLLFEPYHESDNVNGISTSGLYYLDWRKEYGVFVEKFQLHKKDWWRTAEATSKFQIIPNVKEMFETIN